MEPDGPAAPLALTRAGAIDEAWKVLTQGGASNAVGPAAAILRGRLLKTRAARALAQPERRSLYREAAAAYAEAAAREAATYPLINAATLSLLAGDSAQAAAHASDVLVSLDAHPEEPETPYWRSATRAEALLLLGREIEARTAFAEAIALAPRAWEDHASMLRQFAIILAEQEHDAGWLDAHLPPRSVHFGGHMSFDARVGRTDLNESIAALLEEEKVGFGYAALAAGADIIVAEALLARGAEFHAFLPGGVEAFAAVSVDPYDAAWRARFDALLERAETVRTVRPAGTRPDAEMIALGDELAMGAAAMNARRLESEAFRLLIRPEDSVAAAAGPWRARLLSAPRETVVAPLLTPAPRSRRALLAAALPSGCDLETRLALLAARIATLPAPCVAPWFTGREVLLAYAMPAEAARAALALAADAESGVGAHYGIADTARDPFSGAPRIAGESAELAAAAAASTPAGAVCVTDDFAAALAAAAEAGLRTELAGELAGLPGTDPVELYALSAFA